MDDFITTFLLLLFLPLSVISGDRTVGKNFTTRSEVLAQNGMAATSQPLATIDSPELRAEFLQEQATLDRLTAELEREKIQARIERSFDTGLVALQESYILVSIHRPPPHPE